MAEGGGGSPANGLDDGNVQSTSNNNNTSGRSVEGPALTSTGRTIQACDRCRVKKVRCDGTVPTCGRCKAAGLECLTTVKLARKSYPKSYTESIEERLRQLEGEVHKLREGNDTKDKKIRELETINAKNAAQKQPTSGAHQHAPTPSAVSTRHEATARFGPRPATDEPLSREVGRMSLDRNGIGRFMGSSSGIFFIGTAEQRFASTQQRADKQVGDALLRVDVDDQSTEYPIYYPVPDSGESRELPPRQTAERYIDTWFDAWKHIFPILHRPSFASSVEQLYAVSETDRDRSVLGMFYLILALGCRHLYLVGESGSGPTVKSNFEDIEYYRLSTRYLNDILKLNNLTTLQYQELQTIWFLYTGKRSLAFQMTGSMTRLALELGLHRHTRRFHFGPLETELRKRVFWVCYMLDNFVSAVDGLPKSFRDQDIDVELPSDVDDDFVNSTGYLLSLPGEPTGMLTFVSLIKAVRVLSNTLEILYTTTDRRQTVTKIRTIDRLLDQWVHTLPDHLQLDIGSMAQPPSAEVAVEPSVAFLHLAYLYTRFAAHRVAISFYPSTPQYTTSLQRCMAIARELILLNSRFQRHVLTFDVNPGSHVYAVWSCGLMSLFGLSELRASKDKDKQLPADDESDAMATATTCIDILDSLVSAGRHGEKIRAENLRSIIAAMSGNTTQNDPSSTNQSHDELPPSSVPMQHHSSSNPPHSASTDTFVPHALRQNPRQPYGNTTLNSANALQQSRPQPQPSNCSPMNMQSPGLSRMVTSPGFADSFNLDFSSPFAHPYDRLSSFQPSTDSNTGMMALGNQADSGDQIGGPVWDDPMFSLTSITQDSNPPFAMEDVLPTNSQDVGSGGSRKRARINPP